MDIQNTVHELAEYCRAKPGAFEDHPWGDTVFKVGAKGKIFCGLDSANARVTVKSTVDKQSALIQHPDIEVAAYVGRYGWVTVTVNDLETLDLVHELIDESFSLVNNPLRKSKGTP